jgi:hypothetical protein
MNGKHVLATTVVAVLMLASLGATRSARRAESAPRTRPGAATPWNVVRTRQYAIAVPKGWRRMPGQLGPHVLYVTGDGIGAPIVDETGAPIQIGMTVERYGVTKESVASAAARSMQGVKQNPRLKAVAQDPVANVKLADGRAATLIRTVFIKDQTRRSLQLKMFAKDGNSRGWVVSAWIVTGRDSQFIARNKTLEAVLRAHVTSLCFDSTKFSTKALAAAYSPAATQPATKPTTATAPATAVGR